MKGVELWLAGYSRGARGGAELEARRALGANACSSTWEERYSAMKKDGERMKRKVYEEELERLHGELVKLQVGPAQGPEGLRGVRGRDSAGKGGTIKAITEHSQPARVPRGGAARAERPREKPDVHPALPAAPAGRRRNRDLRQELVQPRRRRARDGLQRRRDGAQIPEDGSAGRRRSSIPA